MGGKAKGGGVNWKAERLRQELRLKRVNADTRELERDRLAARYHRADYVADLQNELFLLSVLALETLPAKLAPVVAGESDAAAIADRIKGATREIQDGMARFAYVGPQHLKERFDDLRGKDPLESAPECFERGDDGI